MSSLRIDSQQHKISAVQFQKTKFHQDGLSSKYTLPAWPYKGTHIPCPWEYPHWIPNSNPTAGVQPFGWGSAGPDNLLQLNFPMKCAKPSNRCCLLGTFQLLQPNRTTFNKEIWLKNSGGLLLRVPRKKALSLKTASNCFTFSVVPVQLFLAHEVSRLGFGWSPGVGYI